MKKVKKKSNQTKQLLLCLCQISTLELCITLDEAIVSE